MNQIASRSIDSGGAQSGEGRSSERWADPLRRHYGDCHHRRHSRCGRASQTSWSGTRDVDATTPIYRGVCAPSPSFCAGRRPRTGTPSSTNGSTCPAPTSIVPTRRCIPLSCRPPLSARRRRITGNAIVYNGSSWSAPTAIDHEEEGPGVLNSVSCPTASFCVAVDDDGNAFTYDGSSWSSAANVDETASSGVVSDRLVLRGRGPDRKTPSPTRFIVDVRRTTSMDTTP